MVIAAHNEAENLSEYLPGVLEQEYEDYEVVVALDRCTDGSKKVLEAFKSAYDHLEWVEITSTPEGWGNKKYALKMAIDKAPS